MQDEVGEVEPAPPPDTVMLTDEEPQANGAATGSLPAQQQATQTQQPPAAPQPIQSNAFAAAMAQAMSALTQQQGIPCCHPLAACGLHPAETLLTFHHTYMACICSCSSASAEGKASSNPAGHNLS